MIFASLDASMATSSRARGTKSLPPSRSRSFPSWWPQTWPHEVLTSPTSERSSTLMLPGKCRVGHSCFGNWTPVEVGTLSLSQCHVWTRTKSDFVTARESFAVYDFRWKQRATVCFLFAFRDIDTHTHRVGRTGRAGVKGEAYTLVTANDKEFAGHIVRYSLHIWHCRISGPILASLQTMI